MHFGAAVPVLLGWRGLPRPPNSVSGSVCAAAAGTSAGISQSTMIRVRLTRKFASLIDGIDLSQRRAGDELELSDRDARLLILEGWASATDSSPRRPRKRREGRKPRA